VARVEKQTNKLHFKGNKENMNSEPGKREEKMLPCPDQQIQYAASQVALSHQLWGIPLGTSWGSPNIRGISHASVMSACCSRLGSFCTPTNSLNNSFLVPYFHLFHTARPHPHQHSDPDNVGRISLQHICIHLQDYMTRIWICNIPAKWQIRWKYWSQLFQFWMLFGYDKVAVT